MLKRKCINSLIVFLFEFAFVRMQIDLLYSRKAEELKHIDPRLFDELASGDLKYESVMSNLIAKYYPNMIFNYRLLFFFLLKMGLIIYILA